MTTAWLLARVGQAAGFQFAGLSRWRRREQSLGVPTPQAPSAAAEAGAAPRFPPRLSASSACATPRANTAFGIPGIYPAGPGMGKARMPVDGSLRQPLSSSGVSPRRALAATGAGALPVGEEADVRGKDARRNTQRPATREEKVPQEQGCLEQPLPPRNAGRGIRSVWPLLGTPSAGDRSMGGTGWSAGQFWQSRLFRGCCWERMLMDQADLQEMDQKTATSVVYFLVSFHLFHD